MNFVVHGIDIYELFFSEGVKVAFVLLVFLHITRISRTSYGLPFKCYLYTFFRFTFVSVCVHGEMIHNLCDCFVAGAEKLQEFKKNLI